MKLLRLLCLLFFPFVMHGMKQNASMQGQNKTTLELIADIKERLNRETARLVYQEKNVEDSILPIVKEFIKKDFDPNVQDIDEQTILHYLTDHVTTSCSRDLKKAVKKLLFYGARFDKKNRNQETAYDIARKNGITRNWYREWTDLAGNQCWQENTNNMAPSIRCCYRYIKDDKYKTQDKAFAKRDKNGNRILFCIVHGTGFGIGGTGSGNKDYFDLESRGFPGFLKLAQEYTDDYNQKRKTKGKKTKVLHLISFQWSGMLSDEKRLKAAKKFSNFLNNWIYRKDMYCIVSHSHGSNMATHALGLLVELQKNKLYAIKLKMHFYEQRLKS